jgi:hypothetical protein
LRVRNEYYARSIGQDGSISDFGRLLKIVASYDIRTFHTLDQLTLAGLFITLILQAGNETQEIATLPAMPAPLAAGRSSGRVAA